MTDQPRSAVNDLAHRFWEGVLELNPTTATFYGDTRYANRLEDPSPAGRARARELMERTAAEARSIPVDGLSTEERITRDMLEVIGDLGVEEDDQGLHQLRVVDQMGGPQQLLPQLTAFQPVDTPERLEAFIARLHAYPAFMAANAGILREGLASGLTAPSIVTERVIAQLERMLAIPTETAIVPGSVQGASDEDRERIREIVRDVVYPADAAFLETLRGKYRHASREEPGIWSAPNGDAIYRTAIRSWTTLEMDPEAIHGIGLEELAAIDDERRTIARGAGFGDDIAAYRDSLETADGNTPESKDELVARAREDIDRGKRGTFGEPERVDDLQVAGSPLDRGAADRALSVYVPGFVAPMLPHTLSSDACSLAPDEEARVPARQAQLEAARAELAAVHAAMVRAHPEAYSATANTQVIATPHIAASTREGQELVGVETAAALRDFLKEGVIRNAVNFPSVSAEEFKRLGTEMAAVLKAAMAP